MICIEDHTYISKLDQADYKKNSKMNRDSTNNYLIFVFLILIQCSIQQNTQNGQMVCSQGFGPAPVLPGSNAVRYRCADDRFIAIFDSSVCTRTVPGAAPLGDNCVNGYKNLPCQWYALKRPNQPQPFSCYRTNKKAKTNPDKDFRCDAIRNFMQCKGFSSSICARSQGCTWG